MTQTTEKTARKKDANKTLLEILKLYENHPSWPAVDAIRARAKVFCTAILMLADDDSLELVKKLSEDDPKIFNWIKEI